ncbi:ankyrin [Apiospora hydei]|uniref:Ankyrin n=1 Tax=Apiospora hydei TaxID=1337664 RepID=A0ABR1WMI6_9PEZI
MWLRVFTESLLLPPWTLGRVRRAAQAICELDGGATDDDALRRCVEDLVPLAAAQATDLLKVSREPVSDEGLQADIHIAAVWLGKTAYLKRLVAEGVRFFQLKDEYSFDEEQGYMAKSGTIFDPPIHAAAIRGNVEMIKIILGALKKPQGNDEDESYARVFEFLLENEAYPPCYEPIEIMRFSIPWPDLFERAEAIVERHTGRSERVTLKWAWEAAYRNRNSAEMYTYFLSKAEDGRLDRSESGQEDVQFILNSAVHSRDEPAARVVLECGGVDPNRTDSDHVPLLTEAVCRGRISMVRLLLDHGADPNAGDLAPIVHAVIMERPDIFRLLRERGARLDTIRTGDAARMAAIEGNLTSMADLLRSEGVRAQQHLLDLLRREGVRAQHVN